MLAGDRSFFLGIEDVFAAAALRPFKAERLYPINGGRAFIRTRLMIPSHPQWVSTLNR